jgi:hypothetical protein
MSKAPNLGDPPLQYSQSYMSRLLRTLTQYFNTLDNPGHVQGSTANFSYYNGNEFIRGLVKTGTLSGSTGAGATSILLVDASMFPTSGTAYILDTSQGSASDKIVYTGKSGNTLTGVSGTTTTHRQGLLIVASARTGEVFADETNGYALHIIP